MEGIEGCSAECRRDIDINQSAVRSWLHMNANANRNAARRGIIASPSIPLDPRVDFNSSRSCSYNPCSYSRPFPGPCMSPTVLILGKGL